ncbi:MAG: FKBP-type peptidyl-prolyl cis-trans isomerase [Microbacteriaceae bacterium]
MRTSIAIAVVIGVIGSLAACSSSTMSSTGDLVDTAGEVCVAAAPGDVSNAIEVSGEFGAAPTVNIDTPVETDTTQRTVVIAGDGPVAGELSTMMVEVSLFNGTTGAEITTTGFDGTQTLPFTIDESTMLPGLVRTLKCSAVGTRVVGVIPPSEGYGEQGRQDLSVAGTDSLVFVADVVEITAASEPITVLPYDQIEGLPEVSFADNGEPTITIPNTDPPAETQIGLITAGDGAVVGAPADVTVHYRGINWNTGEIFDDSWSRGAPADFNTSGVIEGFRAALEGQTVGSTLIAVVAPADGYGPMGGSGESIGAEDTIVFVIEIVAAS